MSEHDNHGQSTASWTGTGVILLGGLLIALGAVWTMAWMWIAGSVIVVAGVVLWIAMEKAGKGSVPGQKDATRG